MNPKTAERLASQLVDRHCPHGEVGGLCGAISAGERLEKGVTWAPEVLQGFDDLEARDDTEEMPPGVQRAVLAKVECLRLRFSRS